MARAGVRGFIVAAALLCAPATAHAAGPLGLTDCRAAEGVHQCSGLVRTWDGVPLDVTVTLPGPTARGLPLVVLEHGFGNSKSEYLNPQETAYTGNAYAWAKDGYAVLTSTDRGLWGSCGTPESRALNPLACAKGWIHLADTRYEVRDTQELVGRLVDEGVADAGRIGVTGDSYGGGQSMALAALRDRVMLPGGRLVPWRSPRGRPLRIAAAAPVIPWTDLVGAIAPNGRTRHATVTPATATIEPIGVFKATFANAIFAAASVATGPGQPPGHPFIPGRPEGYLAPPGVDPESDVGTWVMRSNAGEPYTDPLATSIVERLQRFHSSIHIDDGTSPAPLFIGSGFTDDLFPVDEALRFVHRTRREHPRTPIGLLLGDFGHQRASNKPADRARLIERIRAWMDHHVRGRGPAPATDVTATTQTCPKAAPSEGPFTAATFAALARGRVSRSFRSSRTVSSGGDPVTGARLDPAAGQGDGCVELGAADAPGTATYRLRAPRRGYTLLGAPAITARLEVDGEPSTAQLAARLWDVAPGGDTQRLVARGVLRPSGRATDRFELHANGWRFAPGHVPKLELLTSDAPFGRPSTRPAPITVRSLRLTLPVRERSPR